MLYDRLTKQNQPIDWSATHDRDANPEKCEEWYRWYISHSPLCTYLRLIIRGRATPAQVNQFYDISNHTGQQILDIIDHVTAGFTKPYSIAELQQIESNVEDVRGILIALQRNALHQIHANDATVKTWLYNELGIRADQ